MAEERLPFAEGVGSRPLNRRWLATGVMLAIAGVGLFAWLAMGMASSSNDDAGPGRPDVDLSVAADENERPTYLGGAPEVATAEEGAALSQRELTETLREAGWPEQLEAKARAVAGCESGWNPTAIGHVGERGLFQVHPVHDWRFRWIFGEEADPFDPHQNAAVALDIWARFGWDPWSCGGAGEQ